MSGRPSIGSFAWCEQGATLNSRDKVEIVTKVARLQVRELFERSFLARKLMRTLHQKCDLETLKIPDSQMAREATEEALEICTPNTYQHCIRTYLFGGLLAQSQGLQVDHELLYVSSILHDLGISPKFFDQAAHLCFATTGAREASRFVASRGWNETQSRRVYEAVSLHFNPHIDHREHGTEARFVGEGAQLDVLGFRFQRVPESLVRSVEHQYPRNDFAQECMESNARANHPPLSRPGFGGTAGFDVLVRKNPLNHFDKSIEENFVVEPLPTNRNTSQSNKSNKPS
jgi:HD superfamily phosphodiesterase